MQYIGVDIGSTGAKACVMNEQKELLYKLVIPTGWSSVETAGKIEDWLASVGVNLADSPCVATGYGRISVPYADKQITEITCHARGAMWIHNRMNAVVIDIGGQDTKLIRIEDGMVKDFAMNDKCSAGTGRFLEIMANTMGMDPATMCAMADGVDNCTTSISSMCTVFAESEVISLIGRGESKEHIAYAVVESIIGKVVSQSGRLALGSKDTICLTGGLCGCDYIRKRLAEKLSLPVETDENGRFAGAIGAAISAMKVKKQDI